MSEPHPDWPALLDYRSGEPDEEVSRERPVFATAFTLLAVVLVVTITLCVLRLIGSCFDRTC